MSKLLEQVRTAIRSRHYSLRTEQTYIHWIKHYIVFNSESYFNLSQAGYKSKYPLRKFINGGFKFEVQL